MMKKIDLYTYCYNDELFMPFFMDYYSSLVDRITIVDNGSTDNTIKIIKKYKNKVSIRIVYSGMTFWDWDFGLVVRNNIWKESDFHLIMWADLDEIIYKENLRQFLEDTDYDIYQTKGYDMVSESFPKKGSILNIKKGCEAHLEDKYLIWKRSSDIESETAHSILTTNNSVCKGEIKLLHYKYLGAEIMTKRALDIKARVPANSYCKGIKGNILTKYPGFVRTKEQYEAEIKDRLSKAINVI